ncbi:MAG: glucuronate isomerase [Clostridiales bacterium]|nr:glucuronate isomerase [Clostridiales bacterium]
MLKSKTAQKLYAQIKDLPIIDYHCHLDQNKIANDAQFTDIGELWLSGDHYKWRAMRLCGVEEEYITGNASFHDKFIKYAEILPKLIGNPLYYWTHMELRQIFGICEPLNGESAERIYGAANERLKTLSVRTLLKKFRVEYIATTDDPCDDLSAHGVYEGITVAPTFRPDKAYAPADYIDKLEKATGRKIASAAEYIDALIKRLDYFVSRGCKISDHGFETFPNEYADDFEAEKLFARRGTCTEQEKERFFGWLLVKLAKEYRKRNLTMQIHFSVIRNNNTEMFAKCGADSGFDLIGTQQSVKPILKFLDLFTDSERPQIVLYTLNDGNLAEIAAVTGAFRNVRMGAAWWFNDTVQGIKRNLETIAEYSCLGTNLGMLTDSRSFSSYCRFDFFRRILCDHIGGKVQAGEYAEQDARELAENICYYNAKRLLRI